MGLQRVRHDWVTEQQLCVEMIICNIGLNKMYYSASHLSLPVLHVATGKCKLTYEAHI